jgi:methionyl-tRNA formyltransferase
MLMDTGMDTGPVLSQLEHHIEDTDNAGSLLEKLSLLGAGLLSDTLTRWLADEIEPHPQDDAVATTCPLLRKDDGAIDWASPAVEIWRQVRAYNPWPGAVTSCGDESLHIWQAWPIATSIEVPPGTVVEIDPSDRNSLPPHAAAAEFSVQTGDGQLAVIEAQRSGRKPLPSAELLRGMPSLLGSRLGTTN